MKALRPVASRLRLRSSTAGRSNPLGTRNETARAVEGNLGGFCVGNGALVFVRLAHDRRFVGAVLLLFILFVFIRTISGRFARDHEWPCGKFLGDALGHFVAPPSGKASSKQSRRVSAGP